MTRTSRSLLYGLRSVSRVLSGSLAIVTVSPSAHPHAVSPDCFFPVAATITMLSNNGLLHNDAITSQSEPLSWQTRLR